MKRNHKILFPLITPIIFLVFFEIIAQISIFAIKISKNEESEVLRNYQIDINSDKKRVLCIGESTTDGGYPYVLQKFLEDDKRGQYDVIDSGYGGVSTRFFVKNIEEIYKRSNPTHAVLMMGINDGFRISSVVKSQKSFLHKFYIYKFGLYLADALTVSSPEERLLRLINGKRIEEASDFFKSNYSTVNDQESFQLGIDVIYDHIETTDDQLKLLEIYNFYVNKFKDNESRFDRLWVISDTEEKVLKNKNEILEREVNYFTSKTGWNHRLGTFAYSALRKNELAKKYFKKAIQDKEVFERESYEAALVLLKDDQEIIEKLISTIDKKDFVNLVPFISRAKVKSESMKELLRKQSIEFDKKQFEKFTLDNIYFVASYLKKRGVNVIISQYPLRSSNVFDGRFKEFKIIENKENFKRALSKHKYDEIFTDTFGGDFGHMTDLGQKVLAGNVADHILQY